MSTPTTQRGVAAALQPHWYRCKITNVEFAEDFDGWAVRVTVQPDDRRRQPETWNSCGATLAEAILEAILETLEGLPYMSGYGKVKYQS